MTRCCPSDEPICLGACCALQPCAADGTGWYALQSAGAAAAGQALWWCSQGVMLQKWADDQGRVRRWLGHLRGIPTANVTVLSGAGAGAGPTSALR